MSGKLAHTFLSVLLLILIKNRNKQKRKRWWIWKLFSATNEPCHDLLDTLKLEDGSGLVNVLRMIPSDSEYLLQMVGMQDQ